MQDVAAASLLVHARVGNAVRADALSADARAALLAASSSLAASLRSLVLAVVADGEPTSPARRAAAAASTDALADIGARVAAADASEGEVALAAAAAWLRARIEQRTTAGAAGGGTSSSESSSVTSDDVVGAARAVASEAALVVGAAAADDAAVLAATDGSLAAAKSLLELVDAVGKPALASSTTSALGALAALLDGVRARAARDSTQPASVHEAIVGGASKALIGAVAAVVSSAEEALPASGGLVVEIDETNLEDEAERELAACAAAIADATALLGSRPARTGAANLDAFERIADAVLEAATSIALATQNLVRASVRAQREITATQGASVASVSVYRSDPAWSKGLISAAQAVAGAVKHLVNSANRATDKEAVSDRRQRRE